MTHQLLKWNMCLSTVQSAAYCQISSEYQGIGRSKLLHQDHAFVAQESICSVEMNADCIEGM